MGQVNEIPAKNRLCARSGEVCAIILILPRLQAGAEERANLGADVPLPLSDQGEVVLVVEDESEVRRFTVEVLTELCYRVLEADGAANALRLLDLHPEIALLFTDVVMPDVNGARPADDAASR